MGFGPIGLPGSQKCRWPDYPLTLVGRHSKLGPGSVVVQFYLDREKSTLYHLGAFLPKLTGSADRVYKKKKNMANADISENIVLYLEKTSCNRINLLDHNVLECNVHDSHTNKLDK